MAALVTGSSSGIGAELARYGYTAMKKARKVAVHCFSNRLLVLSARLASGKTLTRAVHKINRPA